MMFDRERLSRFYREQVLPRLSLEDVFPNVHCPRRGRRKRVCCPLHGGGDRNFVIDSETLLWKCHSQCQEGGDPARYLMLAERMSFREAVLELARRVGVDTSELEGRAKPIASPRPKPVKRAVRVEVQELPYPPLDQVLELWEQCWPVTQVPSVANAMLARRIDPQRVADLDLARALPPQVSVPMFARYWRRSWGSIGYRWMSLMVDAFGAVRSVDVRNVLPAAQQKPLGDQPLPKSVAPSGGYRRDGLLMTCGLARQIVQTGARPPWWSSEVPLRIVVCEGSKKLAQRVCSQSEADQHAPAVIGIIAGSWSDELSARIPDGTTLYVATDPNRAGARYATDIVQSLAPRIAAGALTLELRDGLKVCAGEDGAPTVRLVASESRREEFAA